MLDRGPVFLAFQYREPQMIRFFVHVLSKSI